MKSFTTFSVGVLTGICLLLTTMLFGQTPDHTGGIHREAFSIGETLRFQSAVLEEERTLNIYLPLNYQTDSLKEYPVIYLLDGSADEDFIHIAGLVQFGSFSWINMIPESIVVGIANVDRTRDLTYPSRDKRYRRKYPTSGGSAVFITFLEDELKPLIEATYRTSDTTTLIGQSLGGLLATEILFKKPEMFNNYTIVSPSLWYDEESLLAKDPVLPTTPKSIFIAVGKEGDIMERVAAELNGKLMTLPDYNARIDFEFFPEQDHGDVLHLAAYSGLRWLFQKK